MGNYGDMYIGKMQNKWKGAWKLKWKRRLCRIQRVVSGDTPECICNLANSGTPHNLMIGSLKGVFVGGGKGTNPNPHTAPEPLNPKP